MRHGPMRSMIARMTGSDFLRWLTAFRILFLYHKLETGGNKNRMKGSSRLGNRTEAVAFSVRSSKDCSVVLPDASWATNRKLAGKINELALGVSRWKPFPAPKLQRQSSFRFGLLGARQYSPLRDAHFRVGPIHLPQGLANLAHGGIGSHRVHDVGHRVCRGNISLRARLRLLARSPLQGIERAPYLVVRPPRAQGLQLGRLLPGDGLVNVENMRRFFVDHELVHAYSDLLFRLGGALELVGGLGDLLLGKPALDGFHHASHRMHLAKVVKRSLFHFERQIFKEVGSA